MNNDEENVSRAKHAISILEAFLDGKKILISDGKYSSVLDRNSGFEFFWNFKELTYEILEEKPEMPDMFWHLFPQAKCVAQDESGKWFAYLETPVLKEENAVWKSDANYFALGELFLDILPKVSHWSKSLVVRPE